MRPTLAALSIALSLAPVGHLCAQNFNLTMTTMGSPVDVTLAGTASTAETCNGTLTAVPPDTPGFDGFCAVDVRYPSISATVSQTNYIVPEGKTEAATVQNRIRIGSLTVTGSNFRTDVTSTQGGTFQTSAVSITWDSGCPANATDFAGNALPERSMYFMVATQNEDRTNWEIANYNASDEFTGWDITIVRGCG